MKEGEVKDLFIRETVILAFSVASAIIVAKVMGHDLIDFRSLRLRSLLALKRVSQSQADAWQKCANVAATSYHKANL